MGGARRGAALAGLTTALLAALTGAASAAEPVTITAAASPPVVERFPGGPCYVGEIEVTQPAGFVLTRSGPIDQPLDIVVHVGVRVTTSDILIPDVPVTATFPAGSATAFVPRPSGREPFLGPARWTLSLSVAPGDPPGGGAFAVAFEGYAPPVGDLSRPCHLVDESIEESVAVGVPHYGEAYLTRTRDHALVSGVLPPGLTVEPDVGPVGTPTALGAYTAVIEVCPFPRLGQYLCAKHTYEFTVTNPGIVVRLAGDDRIATAIVASQHRRTAATDVVLARADTFPDALVGGPLATSLGGPLLLTSPTALDPRVRAEIDRLMDPGGRVHLMGGPAALGSAIESELTSAGYLVTRYAGDNRYATAVAVARAMGSPGNVLVADGTTFADALVAGAAAGAHRSAVLLSAGRALPPETGAYLSTATTPTAIGGPAAAAVPGAPAIVGGDRYQTAIGVATQYFPAGFTAGLATGQNFPDALAGATHIASLGGPLLLMPTDQLNQDTLNHLELLPDPTQVYVYGGPAAIAPWVESVVRDVVKAVPAPE